MMESPTNDPLKIATQLRTDELNRRIDQLWIAICLLTLLVLLGTFIFRRLTGNPLSTLSIVIQVCLNGLAVANLMLLKTDYGRLAQGLFVFVMHLAVPPVLVLYGGTRGFGDIALFMVILISMLYGWKRWMLLTYGSMAATLMWVLYRDSIGRPLTPLLDYSAQFTAIKFVVTMLVMVFVIRYIYTFYNNLLETYRAFAEEQVRLNDDLLASELTLAQLNDNLMQSRQKIITAREEERRRLRRDLHDGLGPTLASQIFRIGVAQRLLEKDPQKTATILADVESGIDATLTDVRRLVYGLRPPLLDQLGLLGAMGDFAAQHQGDVDIDLDLPADLADVSAAVEVAIFFIFQTAVDNVMKHAQATRCKVRLAFEAREIRLTVADDGVGIAPNQLFGVGLTAMKERAEELGGTLDVLTVEPHGTQIAVTIPRLEMIESEKDD